MITLFGKIILCFHTWVRDEDTPVCEVYCGKCSKIKHVYTNAKFPSRLSCIHRRFEAYL